MLSIHHLSKLPSNDFRPNKMTGQQSNYHHDWQSGVKVLKDKYTARLTYAKTPMLGKIDTGKNKKETVGKILSVDSF